MDNYIEYELQETEEQSQGFKITDIKTANWAFRKISALTKRKEENIALAEQEHKRISEWLDSVVDSDEKSITYFENVLAQYYKEQIEQDEKFKLNTPYGRVVSTKQRLKWIYDDEIVINCLKKTGNEQFIRIKEELNKESIKKALQVVSSGQVVTEDGEIIDGITVIQDENKITVKVEKI